MKKTEFLNKILKKNCYPKAWEKSNDKRYPDSLMAYCRADYDGYRWYNKFFVVHKELEEPAVVKEFESVYEMFTVTFPDLETLRDYCQDNLEPLSDDLTEFNLFYDMEQGYYWMRVITREKDYNLYLYCFPKASFVSGRKE